ncbi:MAG: hypothetical protein ABI192_00240 [Bradyrhizobium sp.]
MIKSFTALALIALLAASVIALPGFAPQVKANEAIPHTKADRLALRGAAGACSGQVWPNFDASCLRNSASSVMVPEARLVTARR